MKLLKMALLGVLLGGIAIFLFSDVPYEIEDRWFALLIAPLIKFCVHSKSLLRYIGVRDIFVTWRLLSNTGAVINMQRSFPDLIIEEDFFDGVRVKIYRSRNTSEGKLAGFVFYHGGGFAIGSPENYHYITGHIAKETGAVVISVDYRKVPWHLHPTPLEDCLAATRYFLKHCEEKWRVNPERVFLSGDSAGGNAAMVVGHRLSKENVKLAGAALVYPSVQGLSLNTPSYQENRNDFFLPTHMLVAFRLMYFQGNAQDNYHHFSKNNFISAKTRQEYAEKFDLPEIAIRGPKEHDGDGDPELMQIFHKLYDFSYAPIYSDLTGFPTTLLISCHFDILRDDSVMTERRLRHYNVNVTHEKFKSFHGMFAFAPHYRPANRALKLVVDFVNSRK